MLIMTSNVHILIKDALEYQLTVENCKKKLKIMAIDSAKKE